MAVYQEMQAALRPLTPYPPLNTVLILPDCNEEIMRGMFERFEEVAKAGGILRVRVSSPASSYSSRTPRPISNEKHRGMAPGMLSQCAS